MSANHPRLISKITRLEEPLLGAMRSGDLSFLENIFSEDYVFLGSDGSTWGKEKALEDIRSPEYKLKSLEVENHKITAFENTAIATGIGSVEGRLDKEILTGRYLFMRVWSRTDDGWKITAVTTFNAEKAAKSRLSE